MRRQGFLEALTQGSRVSVSRWVGDGMHGGQSTLRELSGAPATHIIYLPRWCHDPPDARVVAYFITLSSWSPPYARPRWCCGISHRNVSSLCLHSPRRTRKVRPRRPSPDCDVGLAPLPQSAGPRGDSEEPRSSSESFLTETMRRDIIYRDYGTRVIISCASLQRLADCRRQAFHHVESTTT